MPQQSRWSIKQSKLESDAQAASIMDSLAEDMEEGVLPQRHIRKRTGFHRKKKLFLKTPILQRRHLSPEGSQRNLSVSTAGKEGIATAAVLN